MRKDRNDITSIIEYYDNSSVKHNSKYSDIFENRVRSTSSNLNKITNTFKYNTWEITGEHDGIFEKKNSDTDFDKRRLGMSYFSKNTKASDKFRTKNVSDNHEKPNMFKEAIKRNSDIITSSANGEEMIFKRYEQYMSMEVKGVKKIFDIFEVYHSSKPIKLEEKRTFLQKVSGFFKSKK